MLVSTGMGWEMHTDRMAEVCCIDRMAYACCMTACVYRSQQFVSVLVPTGCETRAVLLITAVDKGSCS